MSKPCATFSAKLRYHFFTMGTIVALRSPVPTSYDQRTTDLQLMSRSTPTGISVWIRDIPNISKLPLGGGPSVFSSNHSITIKLHANIFLLFSSFQYYPGS